VFLLGKSSRWRPWSCYIYFITNYNAQVFTVSCTTKLFFSSMLSKRKSFSFHLVLFERSTYCLKEILGPTARCNWAMFTPSRDRKWCLLHAFRYMQAQMCLSTAQWRQRNVAVKLQAFLTPKLGGDEWSVEQSSDFLLAFASTFFDSATIRSHHHIFVRSKGPITIFLFVPRPLGCFKWDLLFKERTGLTTRITVDYRLTVLSRAVICRWSSPAQSFFVVLSSSGPMTIFLFVPIPRIYSKMGLPLQREDGLVFLIRRHICCSIISWHFNLGSHVTPQSV
jgi:hypothetical protein